MKQAAPRSGEWVIVCDGRKALILENAGDDKFINLRSKEVHEHADPPTRGQGTDTPGRAHPSVGTARSAMEQVDWHQNALFSKSSHNASTTRSRPEKRAGSS